MLVRLERLSFLPPGLCILPLNPGGGLDCSTSRALLIDRFEVTWAEWTAWSEDALVANGANVAPVRTNAAPLRTNENAPAVWMNRDEARQFAKAQGMRLPTAREWLRVAAGTRAQRWPWSSQDAESRTNTLDLRLSRAIAAGSFPLDATPAGVHDLLGNVAEWVDGELIPLQDSNESRAWAMGGSYLAHKRPIYQHGRDGLAVCGELVEPDQRSIDLGLRLVVDAEEYLLASLHGWRPNAEEHARLVEIGKRWGLAAQQLLSELSKRPNAPIALDALLEGVRS